MCAVIDVILEFSQRYKLLFNTLVNKHASGCIHTVIRLWALAAAAVSIAEIVDNGYAVGETVETVRSDRLWLANHAATTPAPSAACSWPPAEMGHRGGSRFCHPVWFVTEMFLLMTLTSTHFLLLPPNVFWCVLGINLHPFDCLITNNLAQFGCRFGGDCKFRWRNSPPPKKKDAWDKYCMICIWVEVFCDWLAVDAELRSYVAGRK